MNRQSLSLILFLLLLCIFLESFSQGKISPKTAIESAKLVVSRLELPQDAEPEAKQAIEGLKNIITNYEAELKKTENGMSLQYKASFEDTLKELETDIRKYLKILSPYTS